MLRKSQVTVTLVSYQVDKCRTTCLMKQKARKVWVKELIE
jgi:hypothetical protein